MKTAFVFAAVLCVGMVTASPSGAPTVACGDMTPRHIGSSPLPNPSPYTIALNQKKVQPRADVTLTITAPAGEFLRGFFVQARDASGTPVGTFEVSATVQVIDCLGGVQNAATHVINDDKAVVEVGWVAPSTPTDVTFTVSTVRIVSEFWVGETVPLTVAY